METAVGSRRALVVDDDSASALALCAITQQAGWNARRCDGDEAVVVGTAFRPHLMVLDLDMPGTTGFEWRDTFKNSHGHKKPFLSPLVVEAMRLCERRCCRGNSTSTARSSIGQNTPGFGHWRAGLPYDGKSVNRPASVQRFTGCCVSD